MSNPHDGKTVTCYGHDHDEHDRRILTFEEHGRFIRSAPGDTGFEASGLRFKCPECGRVQWWCPVCSDSSPPGWFRGESTGKMLPCHNCNQSEVAAQRAREGKRAGRTTRLKSHDHAP